MLCNKLTCALFRLFGFLFSASSLRALCALCMRCGVTLTTRLLCGCRLPAPCPLLRTCSVQLLLIVAAARHARARAGRGCSSSISSSLSLHCMHVGACMRVTVICGMREGGGQLGWDDLGWWMGFCCDVAADAAGLFAAAAGAAAAAAWGMSLAAGVTFGEKAPRRMHGGMAAWRMHRGLTLARVG